jgi:two-component system nitrate/nitrite sensor histidine kinase NarX
MTTRPTSRMSSWLAFSRWVIPLLLGFFGFTFVVWESILTDGYSITSPQTLLGLLLLVLAGPALTALALAWAYRVALLFESAEREREREHRQLITLNQIGEEVNQSLELDAVLNRAVDRVLELLNLQSGEVRLLENGQLVLRTTRNLSDEFISSERSVPLGQCLCGKAAQTGELIAIEDIGRATRLDRMACACENFRSVLSVPVRTADRIIGVVHVASHEPRVFNENERTLLIALGHQIGVAIEKARLHAQLKSLNQQLEQRVIERTRELVDAKEELTRKADALQQVLVEERRVEERTRARIAHDLHDSVQQLIVGAMFETQAARDSLTQHPENTVPRLTAAQDLLRRIEMEMRRAIYSLRPVTLDAHGLVTALREYAESFTRHSGIHCDLSVEGVPRRFSPDGEVAVYRIVQEALNNIELHSKSQHVQIHLVWNVRDLHAEIQDNGTGFDLAEVTQQTRTHLGLIGMQERAEAVGGTLKITSKIGEGTQVSLRVPVN